jgi:hypothetical protein
MGLVANRIIPAPAKNRTLSVKNVTAGLIDYAARCLVDRGSLVGISTGYGLDGPGIESQWGREFPHPACCTVGNLSLSRG